MRSNSVLVVGVGALGSAVALALIRAGLKRLRIADFDVVQPTNLSDQSLYTEADAINLRPKVEAAAEKLTAINSSVQIDRINEAFVSRNAQRIAEGMDLIIDAVDNLETKYLINDVAISMGIPYVYGGCVGSRGTIMAIVPGTTPCLRCIWPLPPTITAGETCASTGILPMTPLVIGGMQATTAVKILTGDLDSLSPGPIYIDLWRGVMRDFAFQGSMPSKSDECPACGQHQFDFLEERTALPENDVSRINYGI